MSNISNTKKEKEKQEIPFKAGGFADFFEKIINENAKNDGFRGELSRKGRKAEWS